MERGSTSATYQGSFGDYVASAALDSYRDHFRVFGDVSKFLVAIRKITTCSKEITCVSI
jgi:hypothetical protein